MFSSFVSEVVLFNGGGKDMILGMDVWVFTAWIGTILAALVCVGYGIYYEFIKKEKVKKPKKNQDKEGET